MLTHSIDLRNNILTMSFIVVCLYVVCGQLMVHGYCSDHLRDHHRHHRDRYYGTNRCHHNQLWLLVQQPQQRQCSKSPNLQWSIRAGCCTNHDPIRGSIPHQVYGIPKRNEGSINSRTRDVSLMMMMDPSTDLSDLIRSIPTMVTTGATSVTSSSSSSSSSTSALSNIVTTSMAQSTNDEIEMLSKETTVVVFIIGVIPFVIATYEFWRRIAIGATFGTGNDSIQFPNNNNRTTIITTITTIGEDDAPLSSRGKQVLGSDSLITAYFIFATVAVVLMLVFYSILTSPIPG
jgi:hypothetical protein